MITQKPTEEMFKEWKSVWLQYKDRLKPNRKSGIEVLNYLQQKYTLTEIYDKAATDAVTSNVLMNVCYAEKLPQGKAPIARTFFLENTGNGSIFYKEENKDSPYIWGENITKIFVGIDIVTGFFMVEGSTLLFDEITAFRGLDDKDLQNYVCVAEYINALKKFNQLQDVIQK